MIVEHLFESMNATPCRFDSPSTGVATLVR